MRHVAHLLLILQAFAICLLLLGCAGNPTPFQAGAEVPPPRGCIEYRARGGQC